MKNIEPKTTTIKHVDFETEDYKVRFRYEDDKLKSVFIDSLKNRFQSIHVFSGRELETITEVLKFVSEKLTKENF